MTGPITVSGDAMTAIVAKGILDQMGAEGTQTVVQQAIEYLLTPPEGSRYGTKGPSPLEQAFNREIVIIANKIVAEYLQTDAVKARVEKATHEAIDTMLANEGDWIYDSIGSAVGEQVREALRSRR